MFKPMLAPVDSPSSRPDFFEKLRFPLLGSPKLDGIRSVIKSNLAYSRSGKLLPSYQVQDEITVVNDIDGECIIGKPNECDVYNRTQSHVMSEDKPGDLYFYVFDYTHNDWLKKPFYQRLEKAEEVIVGQPQIKIIEHTPLENLDDLLAFEAVCLEEDYEGIMMRDPLAPYKNGRGTFNEGWIYKLKRFTDTEGIIIGFIEAEENTNVKEVDELGFAKRSTKKEGMVPSNTLGAFIVDWNGMELIVAPGRIDHKMRKYIWDNQELFLYKILKFGYFNHGIKDKPRFPKALGMRSPLDM